jgi:hypothetical protein
MTTKTKLLIPMDEEVLNLLRENAESLDLPVATLVRQLIRQYLGLQSLASLRGASATGEKSASAEKRPVGRPRVNPIPEPPSPQCPMAAMYQTLPITLLKESDNLPFVGSKGRDRGAGWKDAAGNVYNDQGYVYDPDRGEHGEFHAMYKFGTPSWFKLLDETLRAEDPDGVTPQPIPGEKAKDV